MRTGNLTEQLAKIPVNVARYLWAPRFQGMEDFNRRHCLDLLVGEITRRRGRDRLTREWNDVVLRQGSIEASVISQYENSK